MSPFGGRAKELFSQLADLPRERWSAELDARLGENDQDLRREVESLLRCHDATGAFLNPAEVAGPGLARSLADLLGSDEPELRPGQRLGKYTIERMIGAGGMGGVYLARQDRPARTVAIKVIRRGVMSRSMARRFEAEAEALGRLHHPGIAQIFEAGEAEADGAAPAHAFIAMEFVDGPTITEHAESRNLDIRARLELLAQVCDAVHHAHQRGIIHRDIKPANILIDRAESSARAKVLDFGVARALEADVHVTTMRTSVGQLVGTLPYMSPEQVSGDPRELDVRSDVYALGVLMFQLLTGELPQDLSNRSIPEAARMIREEPHRRLSSVSRVFRGELELIAARAMDKDRARRHQTAAELGEDLRRYIRGEPVSARQDSALFVLRTQLARHRMLVRTGVAGIVALAAFSVYAAVQAARSTQMAASEREARIAASDARVRADALSVQLAEELRRARIDVGRLEGAARRMILAEQVLWGEFIAAAGAEAYRSPDSSTPATPLRDPRFMPGPAAHAYWALWELYDRLPRSWSVQLSELARAACTSPDGQLMIIGGDGSLTLLSTADGAVVRRVHGLGAQVTAVEASSTHACAALRDGRIAMVSLHLADQAVQWITPTREAPPSSAMSTLALSHDGTMLAAAAGSGEVMLWDVAHSKVSQTILAHDAPVAVLAFSRDGRFLLTATAAIEGVGAARVWRLSDAALLHEARLSGSFIPRSALLLDGIATPEASPREPASPQAPGERLRIVLGDDTRSLRVIEVGPGSALPSETVFAGPVQVLRLSPSGDAVLAAAGHSTLILDARTLAVQFQQGDCTQRVLGGGWVDNDSAVTVTLSGAAQRVGARTSPALTATRIVPQWTFGVSCDPVRDVVWAAGSDGTLNRFDMRTLAPLGVPRLSERGRSRALLHEPAQDSGCTRVFSGTARGTVRVLDSATGSELWELGGRGPEVYALALHPDGQLLSTGGSDGVISFWNASTGAFLGQVLRQPMRITAMAFSPDGRVLAAAGNERSVTLIDVQTRDIVALLETTAQPWGVAYTPDGSRLLVSQHDGWLESFAPAPAYARRTIKAHQRLVPALAVHPSSRVLATGSEDGQITLWQVDTLDRLASIASPHGEVVTAAFDRSGRWLFASTGGGALLRVDLDASMQAIEAHRPFAP